MHSFSIITVIAAVAGLAQPAIATYQTDKGAQINFYTDKSCTKYTGEAACWWSKSPLIGRMVNGGQEAECFQLNMPGNSLSINTANIWSKAGSQTRGNCYLFDDFNCKGNSVTSNYVPGSGTCFGSRSKDGWLWKSAYCASV
ncbi:unnamed protein product [Clonostachys rosea f. rosea IK726]|jgi:hypothetical protein|uniref:Uncharacterized protein n=2 Tax=Bionectria ochroleuca TaxID=29856 RepID=A0A8H7N0D5_BIOOC|nr:unnamed protein product [Clonostachys rosea f. rosea IK726]